MADDIDYIAWQNALTQLTTAVSGDKTVVLRSGVLESLDIGILLEPLHIAAGANRVIGRLQTDGAGYMRQLSPADGRTALQLGTTNAPQFGGLLIDAAAGTTRQVSYRTSGVLRWATLATTTAESGSNTGSDFVIQRRDDAGASLGNPFTITRSTGLITMIDASVTGTFIPPAKTFVTLPTASASTGMMFRVSDRNHRIAMCDGTNWRYGDNTIAA